MQGNQTALKQIHYILIYFVLLHIEYLHMENDILVFP